MSESSLDRLVDISLDQMSAGSIATLASLLEVTAPKPGNVHRGADFEDVTFTDFVTSGVLLGETIDRRESESVGKTILNAIRMNQQIVGSNTNLGIVLLLVPMAKCFARNKRLDSETMKLTLAQLDSKDCRDVYEAICTASPGGLGTSEQNDVSEEAPSDLVAAMTIAAERDRVARQYSNGFADVFDDVVPLLIEGQSRFEILDHAIVFAHVMLMSRYPDTLIVRKNGPEIAEQAVFRARKCVDALEHGFEQFWSQIEELDFWLRSDGNRRNPGTSADLIAAGLFAGIATNRIRLKANDKSS